MWDLKPKEAAAAPTQSSSSGASTSSTTTGSLGRLLAQGSSAPGLAAPKSAHQGQAPRRSLQWRAITNNLKRGQAGPAAPAVPTAAPAAPSANSSASGGTQVKRQRLGSGAQSQQGWRAEEQAAIDR